MQKRLVTTQSKMVPGVGIEPNHRLITNQLHDLHANKALLQLLSLMNRFIKHISPATDNHEQEIDSDSFFLYWVC